MTEALVRGGSWLPPTHTLIFLETTTELLLTYSKGQSSQETTRELVPGFSLSLRELGWTLLPHPACEPGSHSLLTGGLAGTRVYPVTTGFISNTPGIFGESVRVLQRLHHYSPWGFVALLHIPMNPDKKDWLVPVSGDSH